MVCYILGMFANLIFTYIAEPRKYCPSKYLGYTVFVVPPLGCKNVASPGNQMVVRINSNA